MLNLALVTGYVLVALLAIIGAVVVWKMVNGKIDLQYLVAEGNGQASLSRFQFLVFTFVVAGLIVVLTLESGAFPTLGVDVLALLGISSGSYVISKGIQYSGPAGPGATTGRKGVATSE